MRIPLRLPIILLMRWRRAFQTSSGASVAAAASTQRWPPVALCRPDPGFIRICSLVLFLIVNWRPPPLLPPSFYGPPPTSSAGAAGAGGGASADYDHQERRGMSLMMRMMEERAEADAETGQQQRRYQRRHHRRLGRALPPPPPPPPRHSRTQQQRALMLRHFALPTSFYRADIRCPTSCPRHKEAECAICLDDLSQGDTIARLPCLCIYHKGCIDDWFKAQSHLPSAPRRYLRQYAVSSQKQRQMARFEAWARTKAAPPAESGAPASASRQST
uniref:RING-type E3 ubiquitin transferase n=1 Tax=Macrostomum lignano TaxID=282301 RepID=A0A1I8FE11_9PLAT